MRIITGEYRGSKLFTVQNTRTRPTTDYLKEVMFSVLYDVAEQRVLDLYAGGGGLGLEALSRGATDVVFVDIDDKAVAAIWKNIDKLGCRERCTVRRKKATAFLAADDHAYDLILMDPPYEHKLVNKTLDAIFEHGRLSPGGRILVEHSAEEPVDGKWTPAYQKRFGDSMLTVIQLEEQ